MIHTINGAVPSWNAQHRHDHALSQSPQKIDKSSSDDTGLLNSAKLVHVESRPNSSLQSPHQDDRLHRHKVGNQGGNYGQLFNDVVGAAMFAHRAQMEARAEMKEIKTEVGTLMGDVFGGRLTPHQQDTFNKLVERLAELSNFNGRHARMADADAIGVRILNKFGVEAAPSGAENTNDTGIAATVPVDTRVYTIQSAATPGDTGIAATVPEDTRVYTIQSAAIPGDTGIAATVPEDTRVYTIQSAAISGSTGIAATVPEDTRVYMKIT
jgi:hypothetical protein